MQEISLYSPPSDGPHWVIDGTHAPHRATLHGEGPTLREWWNVIRTRQRLIGCFVLAGVLVTSLALALTTRSYTAQSTILIEPSGPQVLDVHGLSDTPDADEHDYYETQYDILRSRSLANQVIHELRLDDNSVVPHKTASLSPSTWSSQHRPFAGAQHRQMSPGSYLDAIGSALVDDYLNRLQVKPLLGTRLVQIGFSAADPILSAEIVNAHVQAYIHQGMELHAKSNEDLRAFLEDKLVGLRERVEKSEAALNDYRRQRGIVAFEPQDHGKIVMDRLAELNAELTKAESQRIALEAQVELIDRHDYESLPGVINSSLIQRLRADEAQMEAQLAAMRNRFNPEYQPLADLGAKVNEARNRVVAETLREVHAIKSEYASALAQQQKLEHEIEQVKSQALMLNDASVQEAVLIRDVDTSRELYRSVLERMKEIGVAADVPTAAVSVIDPAYPPRFPSSPKVLVSLAATTLVSLFAGVVTAFLLSHLDNRLHTPEEVDHLLELPTLASVPDFAALSGPKRRMLPRSITASVRKLGFSPESKGARSNLGLVPESASFAAEVYRTIRTAILYARAGSPPRRILVTSAMPGEGKTFTAINIAIALARRDDKVLLLDADMRCPRGHEFFGLSNGPGLAEILAGLATLPEAVQPVGDNLDLLCAGANPPNPNELLSSSKMNEFLQALDGQYKHVVFDSPAAEPVSDSIVLSTMADGVILVIGSQTPKQIASTTCRRLRDARARLIGVVLNRVDMRAASYYDHKYHTGRFVKNAA